MPNLIYAYHGGLNPLFGITIVQAETIDGAIDMARDCPHLEIGTIEVAELFEM